MNLQHLLQMQLLPLESRMWEAVVTIEDIAVMVWVGKAGSGEAGVYSNCCIYSLSQWGTERRAAMVTIETTAFHSGVWEDGQLQQLMWPHLYPLRFRDTGSCSCGNYSFDCRV